MTLYGRLYSFLSDNENRLFFFSCRSLTIAHSVKYHSIVHTISILLRIDDFTGLNNFFNLINSSSWYFSDRFANFHIFYWSPFADLLHQYLFHTSPCKSALIRFILFFYLMPSRYWLFFFFAGASPSSKIQTVIVSISGILFIHDRFFSSYNIN